MLFCIRYAPGGGETKRRIKKLCSAHGFASSDTPLPPPRRRENREETTTTTSRVEAKRLGDPTIRTARERERTPRPSGMRTEE